VKIYKKNGLIWYFVGLINPMWTNCATTLFSYIYMPEWYFINPTGNREYALILHEQTHVKQWNEYGWSYIFSYIFSQSSRRAYEMEAYRKQITYLLKQGEDVNEKEWAELISSLYWIFNFITFEEAIEVIKQWKTEEELYTAEERKADKIKAIKAEAERKILEKYPIWKQINLIAGYNKYKDTEEKKKEMVEFINSVRNWSDEEEKKILEE